MLQILVLFLIAGLFGDAELAGTSSKSVSSAGKTTTTCSENGATCQREMQLQFCEGDSHTLSCAHFSKNISILSANYGRLTGAQVCGWGPIKSTHCKADGALAKVQAHCQGRSHCTLRATDSEFGDPCDETYKYLEIRYICE